MGALIDALFYVLGGLVSLAMFLIIAYVISSWLVAFDVINMRNRAANSIVRFLGAVTQPMLLPFRRIIPPLGGMDISPVILILILGALNDILLPRLHLWLLGAVGGG